MREVKQSGDWLPEALRELGEASGRHAPPQVGAALKDAFLRRHAARRRAQNLRLALIAAMVLITAGAVLLRSPRPGGEISKQSLSLQTPHAVEPARVGTALAVNAPVETMRAASRSKAQTPEQAQRRFVALPAYEPQLSHEDLRVVRLQLSGNALRLVGVPVQEESTDRMLLADFVVGQDGTPYAFRLVTQ